jgi:hypothetical protein
VTEATRAPVGLSGSSLRVVLAIADVAF